MEKTVGREYPFVVTGMPNEEYHSQNDHLRRSMIVQVAKYGGEAQRFIDDGHSLFKGSTATTKGSRFDDLTMQLIEGKQFNDVVVQTPSEVLTKSGQRRGKPYLEWKSQQEKEGKICVSADEEWELTMMVDHMMQNPVARELIEETQQTQLSVFFLFDGVPCACRPDGNLPLDYSSELFPIPVWWDLKTTSSTWDRIHVSSQAYGYAEQEAFYTEAAMQLGYKPHRMPFVFVQTMPPYRCRVFHIPQEVVGNARSRISNTIAEIQLRRRTGIYLPVEADQINELDVPQWAQQEEELFNA